MKHLKGFNQLFESAQEIHLDDEQWILDQLGDLKGGDLGNPSVRKEFDEALEKLQSLSAAYDGKDSERSAGNYGSKRLSVRLQGAPIIVKRNDLHRTKPGDPNYKYDTGILVGLGLPDNVLKAVNLAVKEFLSKYTHIVQKPGISDYKDVEAPADSHREYAHSYYIYLIYPKIQMY